MTEHAATEIVVTGSAERRLPADRADMQLTASNTGADRPAVVAAASAIHENIVARAQQLVAAGVAERYTAEAVTTYTNSWRDEAGAQVVEHRASVSVSVELLALDKVGLITTEFAESSVDAHVSWRLSDEARGTVLRAVRAEAVADARHAAADFASALGAGEPVLRELRDAGAGRGVSPIGAPRFAMQADAGVAPEVTVREIAVQVSIEARFEAAVGSERRA